MEVRRLDGHVKYPPINLNNHYPFYWQSFLYKACENVRRDAGPPRSIYSLLLQELYAS
jgi:hypothetical protein